MSGYVDFAFQLLYSRAELIDPGGACGALGAAAYPLVAAGYPLVAAG